jgi:uncharacterized protein (DUF924 family)
MLLDIMLENKMDEEYALKHYQIIDRFNRFPHRNEIFNRESTK